MLSIIGMEIAFAIGIGIMCYRWGYGKGLIDGYDRAKIRKKYGMNGGKE